MCVGGGSAPSPPPPPPPPPPAPTPADPAVTKAKQDARTIAARAGGRGQTLLGGELNTEADNATAKTLLGQ